MKVKLKNFIKYDIEKSKALRPTSFQKFEQLLKEKERNCCSSIIFYTNFE